MDPKEFFIEQLTSISSENADAVRNLAKQLGNNYKELSDKDLQEIITSPQSFLFLARHIPTKQVAGMIMAIVYRIPYVKKAYLDDLIVDPQFRAKGIGKALMSHAVNFTKEKGAAYVDFTARPRREESNSLYEKLGFKKRDTNVYRLIFDYGEV